MSKSKKQKSNDATILDRNKDKVFELIKKDFENSLQPYRLKNSRIRRYRRIYNDQEDGNPKGSSYRSKKFKKLLRKIVPNISQPIVSSENLFTVNITSADAFEEAEAMLAGVINYQFKSTSNFNTMITSLAKTFSIDGTGILKTTWNREEKKKNIGKKKVKIYATNVKEFEKFLSTLDKEKADKIRKTSLDRAMKVVPIGETEIEETLVKVTKNRAEVRPVDPLRVIVDNSCRGDFSKARFLMEVISTDIDTLTSNSALYNIDKIKKLIDNEDDIYTAEAGILYDEIYGNGSNGDIEDYESGFVRDVYGLTDRKRKKIDIIEYWGEVPIDGDNGKVVPIVAIWYNDILLSLKINPMPHKKIPYSIGVYETVDGSVFGESDADIIAEDQIGVTLAMREMQNITRRRERDGTQEFIENGFLPDITQKNNYEKGRTVFFKKGMNPQTSIYRRTVDDIPQVLFDMKSLYQDEINQSMSDLAVYDGQTADVTDGSENRIQKLVDSFSEIILGSGSFIASMNTHFALDGDIFKINNEVKKVSKEILLGIPDYIVSVNTAAKNAQKIQNLLNLMNTRSANMDENTAAIHYAKIAELSGMYDFGKEILNNTINREPTPQEQQQMQMEMMKMQLELKKAELDIERIKSEAMLNQARSGELAMKAKERDLMIRYGGPESEAMLLRAKSASQYAQADKLSAQTGLFEQQFNLEESGEARKREELDKEFSHAANLERESIRTDRELTLLEKKKDANHDGVVTKDESDDFLANYIKEGTLNNDSYDAIGDVYRNILEKGYYENPIAQKPKQIDNQGDNKDANIR